MSTQYHFNNTIYTSREGLKKALDNDWYKKYNKYMVREFFYIGRQFEFEGIMYEVLNNDNQVSHMKGWLDIKSIGENPFKCWVSPRKVLLNKPSLIKELDESLEVKNISFDIKEDHEQMQLF